MFKKFLLLSGAWAMLLGTAACSSDDTEYIEQPFQAVFEATILEMYDEPQANWYFDEMTILVTSEAHGRMVFDHRRLADIGATVGDVVELTITGEWVQPDPQPVVPDRWRLIDEAQDLLQSPALRVNVALNGVELTVVEQVHSDSNVIALRLFNGTEHTITYGASFLIEFLGDEGWQSVQAPTEYIAFIDIGYQLPPGEVAYFERELALFFPNGFPHSGRYRVRIDLFNDADIPIREDHLHDVVAEFDVE